jgi:hypothetical protein
VHAYAEGGRDASEANVDERGRAAESIREAERLGGDGAHGRWVRRRKRLLLLLGAAGRERSSGVGSRGLLGGSKGQEEELKVEIKACTGAFEESQCSQRQG